MDEQQEHPEQDRILCDLAGVASDMYNGVGGVPDWCERLGLIAERIAAHGWRQQDEIARLRAALLEVAPGGPTVPFYGQIDPKRHCATAEAATGENRHKRGQS